MLKKIFAMSMLLLLIVAVFTACGDSGGNSGASDVSNADNKSNSEETIDTANELYGRWIYYREVSARYTEMEFLADGTILVTYSHGTIGTGAPQSGSWRFIDGERIDIEGIWNQGTAGFIQNISSVWNFSISNDVLTISRGAGHYITLYREEFFLD